MVRRYMTTILLLYALLLPGLQLRAQQPQPTPTQQSAQPSLQQGTTAKDTNDPVERIKDEGLNRSQVMQTLMYLTDVIGPRLTASPGMKRANDWTRERLSAWGLENAHLEAWGPFGRGWTLKRFNAEVVEPQAMPLIAYPKAWSPGIKGTLTADVIYVDAKDESELQKYKGKLKGAIVLTSLVRDLKARFEPLGTRLDEKELLKLADAIDPKLAPPRRSRLNAEQRAAAQFLARKYQFFTDEGAALLVDPSRGGDGGTIFVQGAAVPQPFVDDPFAPNAPKRINPWDKLAPTIVPQIVVATEHYNRMARMLQQGVRLRMSVNLQVEFQDQDPMGYNTIAELTGTDLKEEIVMLGAHMDSWHAGTGATDNAAGVAVAMEAVRILKTLGLQPRRTIRIALWSGEEQGLLGSRAYVAEHFGKFETVASTPTGASVAASNQTAAASAAASTSPGAITVAPQPRLITKPAYEKFSTYFNLDNGTGKIRGVYLQGNEAVRPLFSRWLMPFREMGASTLSLSNTGGTDHLAYDAIGLPGFQFIQDEIEYDTRTHHSNQDVFDRIQADDMKQAAVIMAAFIYQAAMTDEKLPRKPVAGR
jgi:carboxypeptidase Q